jgi:hypothetical protein
MGDHSMPESIREQYEGFCAYCGLPYESHPVEYSPHNEKSGIFCKEPVER